ncbi:multiple epidermal growth factor-like domains protein 10 isoform X2 [Pecten maximus]|uniref:multiple epidermal growth factor-like domains protein 10 isoform X2 n=1 Tax=Pecten maximus TaxID=6579 RepID=UPI001458B63F|nr:multiple epidermal growth factor-like domains protein 10 isoform X2 [Pecten maximus]
MSVRKSLGYWVIFLILLFIVPASRPEINVALTGTASQSSDDQSRWGAGRVIDNCTTQTVNSNCCSHTKSGTYKEAWWRVDLGQTKTILYVTIYYRGGYANRFGGYSLYLSNTTSYTQGVLCYKDHSSLASDVQLNPTHSCPYVARYVIVYNQRDTPKKYDWYDDYAVLELCEVQVFGCPTGTYGNDNCNNPCSESCFGGNCNPVSGSCFYCFAGMYGDFCQVPCTANCYNACEKNSGHCIGCIAGKTGDLCDTDCPVNCVICNQTLAAHCYECVNGMHGETCHLACSDGCKDKTCMKDNGYCLECITGKYGNTCGSDCSINCKDRKCRKSDGHCLECVDGKHGDICESDCSNNCENKLCKKDGHCLACIPGKQGNLCDVNCPSNCVTCDQTTDQCFGCIPGFYGNTCNRMCSDNCKDNTCIQHNAICTGCDPGFHGYTCYQTCSAKCKDQICNQNSGLCAECVAGLYGPNCNLTCPVSCQDECDRDNGECKGCVEGFHGDHCSKVCPDNCINSLCLQENGHCTECKAGYFNDHCDRSCPPTCKVNVCDQITGSCTVTTEANSLNITAVGIGSGCGLVILALVIVIMVLVRRQSREKSDTTPHVTDMSEVVRQQKTDGTYEEIEAMPTNQCVQMETINDNYEKLDTQTMESTHVYQTTEQVLN